MIIFSMNLQFYLQCSSLNHPSLTPLQSPLEILPINSYFLRYSQHNLNFSLHNQVIIMKITQKVGSLLRRKIAFFSLSYDWDFKQLHIYRTIEDYMAELIKLRDMGMCKRCQCTVPSGFVIGDLKYDVRLVSFGDIRAHRCVLGENPISKEFGICMFDYVFLFLKKRDAQAEEQPGLGLKQSYLKKQRFEEISLEVKET